MLALLALLSRNPFVFPSFGPTAYLQFFSPLSKASSPRNTIFGHATGLVCGYEAFVITGSGAYSSLGIIWRPREFVVIEVAVLLLVAQSLVINRLAGE